MQQWPSGWSVPCVLAWFPWPNTEVTHLKRFEDNCWKSCIVAPPGTQRHLPPHVSLIVNSGELKRYNTLHAKHDHRASFMVCGGLYHNSMYWASSQNNMPPSCGRCISKKELVSGGCLWVPKQSKVYFCERCEANDCKNDFWN